MKHRRMVVATLLVWAATGYADELDDLKRQAAQWPTLDAPARAELLAKVGARPEAKALPVLVELATAQGERLHRARKALFDANQERLVAGSGTPSAAEQRAHEALDAEQQVVDAYRGAWRRQCEVKADAAGIAHLLDAAAAVDERYVDLDERRLRPTDRWERHALNQQFNVLIAARDEVVRGVAALREPAAFAQLEKDGFGKRLKGVRQWSARAMVVEGVGAGAAPDAVPLLIARLEDAKEHFEVRVLAAGALADRGAAAADRATPALVKALKGPEWQLQVAAVEALGRLGARDAVKGMIDALPDLPEGRPRRTANDVLHGLTGANFYGEPKLWQQWWKDHGAEFLARPPDAARPAPAAPPADPSRTTGVFYDIEVRSKRVFFVIDRSGSMLEDAGPDASKFALTQGPGAGAAADDLKGFTFAKPGRPNKFEIAQIQLVKVLRGLPADAQFNIIFFSHDFDRWKPEMQPANAAKKQEAIRFVLEMDPVGSTNIFDPLESALTSGLGGRYGGGADTIYLLTDGIPNEGRLTDTREINAEVRRLNLRRKAVIHTICIGDADEEFLKQLAKDAGGEFRKF